LKRAFSELSKTAAGHCRITTTIVQSLNSPFFPPHIGAEPGRAKEESRESRITLLSPAQVEPLYGAGRKESSRTGLPPPLRGLISSLVRPGNEN